MIDIHCHMLPETDDGAGSWQIALEMCRIAAQDGIEHVAVTPHANDRYAFNRSRHQSVLKGLQSRLEGSLQLTLGCDFHLSYENLQAALRDPAAFAIGDTQYILVELSDFSFSHAQWSALERLQAVGVVPIITHPERNAILSRDLDQVVRLASIGCLIQLTANALTGGWGPHAKHAAEWLLTHDTVHVLASDAHDTKHRPPSLSQAWIRATELTNEHTANALVRDNPAAILAGGVVQA
jgi:protein-tyrosine phosphatase